MFDFPQDLFRLSALLPSANIGDNTVGTEIIAPEHDIDAAFEGIGPFYREILHDGITLVSDIYDLIVRHQAGTHQFRKPVKIVRSEYEADVAILLPDPLNLILLLHHTSAQGNLHTGILFPKRTQSSKTSIEADIRIFPDRAGIVENKVRVLRRRFMETGKRQNSAELFGISLIHLAAKGNDTEGERPAKLLLSFLCNLPAAVDKIRLSKRAVHDRRLLHDRCFAEHLSEFFRFKNCVVFQIAPPI